MGTHPKAPSIHKERNIPLSDWLKTYPEFLGEKIRERFPGEGELPFLFKVLSVGQSLSIQAHPDKVTLCVYCSLDCINIFRLWLYSHVSILFGSRYLIILFSANYIKSHD